MMKDRIDPLIFERAPWMLSEALWLKPIRRMLNWALSYRPTVEIAERIEHKSQQDIMNYMSRMLAKDVKVSGLSNIPSHGAALIVCNHPTGIADGIVLWHALARKRPDLFYYANSDILRVLPQLHPMIAPVEWRKDKRSHGKTRETMAFTRQAVSDGRIGVIFPSGRLAKRRGINLYERPWMTSAAMLARKFELPVIPVNLQARNSILFYLLDQIHPTLRDITLFHETLNKARQPFVVTIGEPIAPASLPASSDAGIEMLRRSALALGGQDAPKVSLVRSTRSLLSLIR